MVFDPDAWGKFEERTRQVGISPSSFFRKVVSDYLDGRYIHLDTAQPTVFEELQKRQGELKLTTVQPIVDMIMAEWVETRRRPNPKK